MDVLLCPKCQTPSHSGFKFCSKCGSRLEVPAYLSPPPPSASASPAGGVVCSNCLRKNRVGAKHCAFCGAALAVEIPCPRCHHLNRIGAVFCAGCGQDLRGTPHPRPEPSVKGRSSTPHPSRSSLPLWIGLGVLLLFGSTCFLVGGGTLAMATGMLPIPEFFASVTFTATSSPSPVPPSPTFTLTPTTTLTGAPTATATPIPTETPSPTITPEPTFTPTTRPTGAPFVGKFAPDFTLEDARTGEMITLSSLTGHPVMINFWATWCGWCEEEMPYMEAAYEDRADEGLIVLGIDVEESKQEVVNFADSMGLTFTLLLDPYGNVSDLYQIYAYPTSYFITPEGIIKTIYLGALSEGELLAYLDEIME